jgi:hypothetical protein
MRDDYPPQQDPPRNSNVLCTLVSYNKIDVGGGGLYLCAGAYAAVSSAGWIRRGDPVTVS